MAIETLSAPRIAPSTHADWTRIKINRTQTLMTKAELGKLPALGVTDGIPFDQKKGIVHYFGGTFDFWAVEFDAQWGEFFGYTRIGGNGSDGSWGYMDAHELAKLGYTMSLCGRAIQMPLERDLHFDGSIPCVD